MIKANLPISTIYGDTVVPVEVLGSGPRPGTAHVQAMNGMEPFTKFSPGGSYQDHNSVVLIPRLKDVHIEAEPGTKRLEELETDDDTEISIPERCLPTEWVTEDDDDNPFPHTP